MELNSKVRSFKRKPLSRTFLWCCLLCFIRWFYLLILDKNKSVTIQMKATKQYFPVVLFIVMYKVVLTFKPVDVIPKCDHSNESC